MANASTSLWKNRDYLLLWLGQGVSSVGTGITQFAFPLLILSLTNSFADAGFAGALGQLPYLLFSLPAGALVDRWNRKRMMIVCTIGLICCVASIPLALLAGHLTVIQLYVTSFVMGTFFVFYRLGEVAALTQVVPKTQLPTAVAQDEAVYSSVQLLAPSLGGVLMSVGTIFPFMADIVSYFLVLGSLLCIRTPFQRERHQEHRHLLMEVWEGITWLWSHRVLRFLAFLTGYFYIVMSASVLLVYAIARQQHISLAVVGVILGVGGGGNILGMLLCPFIQRRVRFGWMLTGILTFFVLLWPLYGIAITPVFLGAVVVGLAAIDSMAAILVSSYRLTVIPDELQGRVISVFRLIFFGFLTGGQFVVGQCIEQFGVLITLGIVWVGLALFLLLIVCSPTIRKASA